MTIAAIIALLLQSGVCAPTDFHTPDGQTLRVVVCPLLQDSPAAPPTDPDDRNGHG